MAAGTDRQPRQPLGLHLDLAQLQHHLLRARLLTGNPTGMALEPTRQLLESYSAWLEFERRYLDATIYPQLPNGRHSQVVWMENAGAAFHSRELLASGGGFGPDGWRQINQAAQRRAALVLSAVGCDWRTDD